MSILKKLMGVAGQVAGAAFGMTKPKISLSLPSLPSIGSGVSGQMSMGGFTVGGEFGKRTEQTFFGQVSGGSTAAGQNGSCPRGFHLNKHALPASKRHGAVPARSLCVRNRHLNALNGRAAGRALRRLKRADKMTRKIHHLFHRTPRKAIGRKR